MITGYFLISALVALVIVGVEWWNGNDLKVNEIGCLLIALLWPLGLIILPLGLISVVVDKISRSRGVLLKGRRKK